MYRNMSELGKIIESAFDGTIGMDFGAAYCHIVRHYKDMYDR